MTAMRYLGVDPGGKRLGLATADGDSGIVTPLRVIPYRGVETAAADMASLANELRVDRIVVGMPTDAEGAQTSACRRSHAIAEALRRVGLDVVLQPEHLSSHEARRRAREAGADPRQPVDHLAAAVILEDFLAGGG
jgi:putative Holliday junction resolvase